MRNSVRDKLKNSVAFSGNAQTAAVRLRHAFKRHARRGVSAGGGARCSCLARAAWSSRARAPSPRRRTWGRCAGSSASNWTRAARRAARRGAGNAPVEAVVRDVARCVAGVCWRHSFSAANNFTLPIIRVPSFARSHGKCGHLVGR